jgi:hypothetical protein
MDVPTAPYGFKDKPVPLVGNILFCNSCQYSVTLTDTRNTTDIIYFGCRHHPAVSPNKRSVKMLWNSDNHYCEKEDIEELPGTIKRIGSNSKLKCKIKQNSTRQNETISSGKRISRPCNAVQSRALKIDWYYFCILSYKLCWTEIQ